MSARAPAPARRPAPVAAPATLRRIAWVASGWAVLGAGLYLAQGAWRGALALTLAAAASIVGFRGLEGLVRRLRLDAQGGIGEGAGVRFHVRFLVLLTALILALILGGRDYLALILGLTALPLAVITEALIQLVSLATRRESGDGSTG